MTKRQCTVPKGNKNCTCKDAVKEEAAWAQANVDYRLLFFAPKTTMPLRKLQYRRKRVREIYKGSGDQRTLKLLAIIPKKATTYRGEIDQGK
eukprot:1137408-Pelagomonas_calceolata.AAC.1